MFEKPSVADLQRAAERLGMNPSASYLAAVQDIIGPTEKPSITVITCDGTFNTRTHEYDKRLIVRAELVI